MRAGGWRAVREEVCGGLECAIAVYSVPANWVLSSCAVPLCGHEPRHCLYCVQMRVDRGAIPVAHTACCISGCLPKISDVHTTLHDRSSRQHLVPPLSYRM